MAIISNLTVDQGSTFSATIDITDVEDNILVLKGSVPGKKNTVLKIQPQKY